MAKKCLIIGYGRAGHRHTEAAQGYGLEVYTVDPDEDVNANFLSLGEAIASFRWDYAVIASPPDCHLEQLETLLSYGVAVLCEKPLCAMGQMKRMTQVLHYDLRQSSKAMVAYNYRYHPVLTATPPLPLIVEGQSVINLIASHTRDLPLWGLLLDHVSHDIDIIRAVYGNIEAIESALHEVDYLSDSWRITGRVVRGHIPFYISETVYQPDPPTKTARSLLLNGVQISADPLMFKLTWDAFMDANFHPSLFDALLTQRVLETILCVDDAGHRRRIAIDHA